ADVARAERGQEVVDLVELEQGGQLLGRRLAEPQAGELLLHDLAAADDVLLALLPAEPLADLLAGMVGLDVVEVRVQPVAARALGGLRGDDLDDLAVLELVVEADQPTIDLAADAAVADVGVDAVGEVERGRAGRQLSDL